MRCLRSLWRTQVVFVSDVPYTVWVDNLCSQIWIGLLTVWRTRGGQRLVNWCNAIWTHVLCFDLFMVECRFESRAWQCMPISRQVYVVCKTAVGFYWIYSIHFMACLCIKFPTGQYSQWYILHPVLTDVNRGQNGFIVTNKVRASVSQGIQRSFSL